MRRPRSTGPAGAVDVAAAHRVPTRPPFLEVRVAGERILLARRGDGTVAAFEAACPHLGRSLRRAALEDDVVTCREHHHRYDLRDGGCVWPAGSGDAPLGLYEAGERDGRVWIRPRSGC